MSETAPLPGVPDPEPPAAQILTATAAATGLPPAVVLDRAIRAWAALVAAAEAGELLWAGRPDADHLDRLTFATHLGGGPLPGRDAPAADPTTQVPTTAEAPPAAEDPAGKEASATS